MHNSLLHKTAISHLGAWNLTNRAPELQAVNYCPYGEEFKPIEHEC